MLNRARLVAATIAAIALGSRSAAHAQCEEYGWKALDGVPGVYTPYTHVYAALPWDPDGPGPKPPLLVVGGSFRVAGRVPASGIATWDGAAWRSLAGGFEGGVLALAVFQGELIAAGHFSSSGETIVSNIARWNGTAWAPLGTGTNERVRALLVHDGELIAGGDFTMAGQSVCNRIARWNGVDWQPVGAGFDVHVAALAVYQGALIAGGQFNEADGGPAHGVARWDGVTWSELGGGIRGGLGVRGLAPFDGDLIAVGQFDTAGTAAANNVARWDGNTWSPLGPGAGDTLDAVTGFAGNLVVGGYAGAFQWRNEQWEVLGGAAGQFFVPHALCVHEARLIVGGQFSQAGNVGAMNVAAWDGAAWHKLGTGFNGSVDDVDVYQGDLIAAGTFTSAGATNASRIARWDGAAWHALGDGIGDGRVYDLATYNGDLIAAGEFGSPGLALARWDGAGWHTIPGHTFEVASALRVHQGELYVGGSNAYSGWVSRWNGATWTPMQTGLLGVNGINDFAVVDGELYAGGNGTGGIVFRWDGARWQRLPNFAPAASTLYELTVFDGKLIAAGSFNIGPTQYWAARWDGPSAGWTFLGDGAGRGGYALAVTVYRDEIVLGGAFTVDLASGRTSHIARGDGSAWHSLGTGLHWGLSASALGEYAGDLIVGGEFAAAGGVVSPFLARWGCTESPCPGDIDRDGRIDSADLDGVLASFGTHPPAGSGGDIDHNGVVDQADVDIVLFNFGVTCP